MISIDKQSRKPVYEQLVNAMEREILAGVLQPGEQIPSVRTLSVELGVNPNTIQKAYNELERREITYSVPGVGRFVAEKGLQILRGDLSDADELLQEAVGKYRLAKVSLDELVEKVTSIYKDGRVKE